MTSSEQVDDLWPRPELVRRLAGDAVGDVAYLCASVENEVEVWEMSDAVVCLVIDVQTLRRRLATRTTIVDASQPLDVVAAEVVTVGQGLLRDCQG